MNMMSLIEENNSYLNRLSLIEEIHTYLNKLILDMIKIRSYVCYYQV